LLPFTPTATDLHDDLASLLKSLLLQLGSVDERDYRASFGEDWGLYYQREKVRCLEPEGFGIVENYQLRELPFTYLSVDELLDVYLVLKKLEKYSQEQRAAAFWTELGLAKAWEGTDPGGILASSSFFDVLPEEDRKFFDEPKL